MTVAFIIQYLQTCYYYLIAYTMNRSAQVNRRNETNDNKPLTRSNKPHCPSSTYLQREKSLIASGELKLKNPSFPKERPTLSIWQKVATQVH